MTTLRSVGPVISSLGGFRCILSTEPAQYGFRLVNWICSHFSRVEEAGIPHLSR